MTALSEVPPSLADALFCLRILLDCLDPSGRPRPGGVIKWRASERVSLARSPTILKFRNPRFTSAPTGLLDSRPLRRRRPSPSRSFDEFLQGYSNGRTNYRGTALHCRNGVDGPLGHPGIFNSTNYVSPNCLSPGWETSIGI